MRGMLRFTLAMVLAGGLVGLALAQRGGFRGFGQSLILNESVQKELKMTADQVDKVKAALEKVAANHKDDFAKLKDLPKEDAFKEGRKVFQAVNEEGKKVVAKILDEKQMKRFRQIELQNAGPRAFSLPEVQKDLKLTDDQKTKIREIGEDAAQKRRDLFQGGNFNEETRTKMTEINKQTMEKTLGVLTDEQKASWKKMIGKSFRIEFPQRKQKQ